LLSHITGGHLSSPDAPFQPMNINYGLLPPIAAPPRGETRRRGDRALARRQALGRRALADLGAWAAPLAYSAA
jgi:methylenetetrahydrofolate--tRNA-(uracil-5-)-methyltransferase